MVLAHSVAFFDRQFGRQIAQGDFELNPFEALALPYLHGTVLDYGCGLGNLAFAAARRGCRVTALDASPAAIAHVRARAEREGAAVQAVLADLRDHAIEADYDSVVAIGLLMFFDCATARRVLQRLRDRTRPGGVAAINVLVEGTTYLEMFDPDAHCLFGAGELRLRFADWTIACSEDSTFAAPGATEKRFCTLVARRPELACGSARRRGAQAAAPRSTTSAGSNSGFSAGLPARA